MVYESCSPKQGRRGGGGGGGLRCKFSTVGCWLVKCVSPERERGEDEEDEVGNGNSSIDGHFTNKTRDTLCAALLLDIRA